MLSEPCPKGSATHVCHHWQAGECLAREVGGYI